MALSNATLSILVLVSLSLAIVAVVLLLFSGAPRGRSGRPRAGIPGGKRIEALEEHGNAIRRLEGAVRKLALAERRLGTLSEEAVRHVGVVRFDAFEEMGGRLSFSAALLDSHGDGVVITSINGRQETRCYAKQVSGGASVHHLSDEERQAIRDALEGGGAKRVAQAGQ